MYMHPRPFPLSALISGCFQRNTISQQHVRTYLLELKEMEGFDPSVTEGIAFDIL